MHTHPNADLLHHSMHWRSCSLNKENDIARDGAFAAFCQGSASAQTGVGWTSAMSRRQGHQH